jgi:hypothetical protein
LEKAHVEPTQGLQKGISLSSSWLRPSGAGNFFCGAAIFFRSVEIDQGSVGGYESPFEEAVARKLSNLGWRVVTQIGVSSFRIDLGVVHPDAQGSFLAGVECDGATYHRSATVILVVAMWLPEPFC